jgi:glucosamine-6-phosphate deaminase
MAERAAQHVGQLLERRPDAAIALASGNTPLGLYRRLAALRQAGRLSCIQARFFNLDEFAGKSLDDPQSYGAFLWRHVFGPLAVDAGQIRLLHGNAPDLAAECRSFERAIGDAGGLDLAILGLGANGHLAFNEPGSDWDSVTREVVLAETTRRAQQGLFAQPGDVPRHGLTMGLRTIRAARALLLLVSGSGKSGALEAMLSAKPDANWPVTAILDHPRLTVLADNELNPETVINPSRASSTR